VAAGYRCVARNLRTRSGEIDLLLRKGRLYIAVEVKTRTLHPAPERLVGDLALARLRTALLRLAPHLEPRPRLLRIDVMAVRLREGVAPELRHFRGDEFAPPRARGAG
jgi:putative endonuclease